MSGDFYCKVCDCFVGNPVCSYCGRDLMGDDIAPDDIDTSLELSNTNMFVSFNENDHFAGDDGDDD